MERKEIINELVINYEEGVVIIDLDKPLTSEQKAIKYLWDKGLETHKREEEQNTSTKEETEVTLNVNTFREGWCVEFMIGVQLFRSMQFNDPEKAEKYSKNLAEAFSKLMSSAQQNNNSISEEEIMKIGNIMYKYDLNDAEETYKCAEEILSKLTQEPNK